MLAWKRGDLGRAVRGLVPVAVLAVALGALVFAMQTGRSALGPVGVALGAWSCWGRGSTCGRARGGWARARGSRG